MTQQRIHVYDRIRALAIVFIVLLHSSGLTEDIADYPPLLRLEYSFLHTVIAAGIPLFLMLSGALLLGKEEPVGVFFKKRFLRIIPPFLVWTLVTFTLNRIMGGSLDALHFIPDYLCRLLNGQIHDIYWFVYVIIGIYLLTPVLRIVCREEKPALYLTAFLGITALCNQLFPDFELTRQVAAPFTGALFCYLAGFVIVRYLQERTDIRRILYAVGIAVFIFDIVNRLTLRIPVSSEIFYTPGLFAFLLTKAPERISPVTSYVSKCSYGIYLSHFLLISALVRVVGGSLPVAFHPFIVAAVVLPVNTLVLWAADRLRLGKFVM